jgi:hypothetical protein
MHSTDFDAPLLHAVLRFGLPAIGSPAIVPPGRRV